VGESATRKEVGLRGASEAISDYIGSYRRTSRVTYNSRVVSPIAIRIQRTLPPLDGTRAGFGFGGTKLIGSIFTGMAKSTNPASISSQV
jgi:hypothetical protein